MGNGCKQFTINYKDKTRRFTGRNGYIKQYGINAWYMLDNDNVIYLNPITSKGLVGNCELQIPKEQLQEFIEGLKTFL